MGAIKHHMIEFFMELLKKNVWRDIRERKMASSKAKMFLKSINRNRKEDILQTFWPKCKVHISWSSVEVEGLPGTSLLLANLDLRNSKCRPELIKDVGRKWRHWNSLHLNTTPPNQKLRLLTYCEWLSVRVGWSFRHGISGRYWLYYIHWVCNRHFRYHFQTFEH